MTKFLTLQVGTGRLLLVDEAGVASGDVAHTIFSASNNEASFTDITGFTFNPSEITAARIFITVELDATVDLYETFDIKIIEKNGSWDFFQESIGDASGVSFSITNAGQMQYTSGNYSGFVSLNFFFRAIVTRNS